MSVLAADKYSGLSDEATGVLRHHQDWRREDFAHDTPTATAFSTTLIQLLRAYSIFSSDGLLVEPRLVSAGKPFVRRKIRRKTAKRIRRVMQGVTKGHGAQGIGVWLSSRR